MMTNYAKKEIAVKVVYYGAALSGKTTNIEQIFQMLPQEKITSPLNKLDTDTERTIYFDFMSADAGKIAGFDVKIHLYTIPGQQQHFHSRKNVLRGADAVVLVADSQREVFEENQNALKELRAFLAEHKLNLDELPYVLQLNKRDLPGAVPVEELKAALCFKNEPVIEASAVSGAGVWETLQTVNRLLFTKLRDQQTKI